MVIKLRSKRLSRLFAEVWDKLPPTDRNLIEKRILLVIDNSVFLPNGYPPVLGAAVGIGFKRLAALLYFSPRRLQTYSDDVVRFVMAHEIAHVFLGHVEKLLLSPLSDSAEESNGEFEQEADNQAKEWGL